MVLELAAGAGLCLIVMLVNLVAGQRKPAETAAAGGFGTAFARLCQRFDLGGRARFDARRPTHQLAALLLLTLLVLSFARPGAAAEFNLEPSEFLLRQSTTSVFYAMLALLGVGWQTRRSGSQVLRRLGLNLPTARDWLFGLALGALLFALSQAGVLLWAGLAGDSFELQSAASREIFAAMNASLPAGIMLALAAAIGEEILFRGALQPVFGIALSSLAFVLLHGQYLFTPGALILFAVSLGFGWLRAVRGTSAAIICHALYNLLPFVLQRLAG